MHPIFKNTTSLGFYWKGIFVEDVQTAEVRLCMEPSTNLSILERTMNNGTMGAYARDALHYALVSHYRDNLFWEFLFNDTYNMQQLFYNDQSDIIITVLLILEALHDQGFIFPKRCYNLDEARDCIADKTEATRLVLENSDFEPYCFAISPLLASPDDSE